LLPPIVLHIANAGGVVPTAHYVGVEDTIYDADTKRRLFPTLVKYMLLPNAPELDEQNDYARYDVAVKEEIGRILLEYYALARLKMKGGEGGEGGQGGRRSHTRKRRRHCRWLHHATIRSRGTPVRTTRRRATPNKGKRKHTRTMR